MEAVTTAWDSVDWDRLQVIIEKLLSVRPEIFQARVETEVESLGQRQDDSETRRKRLVEESNAYRDRTDKVAFPRGLSISSHCHYFSIHVALRFHCVIRGYPIFRKTAEFLTVIRLLVIA